MQLCSALRLSTAPRVALVGAGGKTTALFRLAHELVETAQPCIPATAVLVTTTTHLGTGQVGAADHHFTVVELAQLQALERNLPAGISAVTGPPAEAEPDRLTGLDGEILMGLRRLADARGLPLLIEADGARQRPLKAPGEHEPPIPQFVDTVIVVANLSALGQPLEAGWVHRPERFASLSGTGMGESITVEGLQRVLAHPNGGLKNIPLRARRVALLNQADPRAPGLPAQTLAGQLLGPYQAVLVGAADVQPVELAIGPTGFDRAAGGPDLSTQPGGTAQAHGPILAVYERVAGVVLAAGGATRYGQPKQLLAWRGEPLVRHAARTALQAGLSPVAVVTGANAGRVRRAVEDLPVVIVVNPEWAAGQSASLQAGLGALPPETGAVIFLLADQPQIPVELLHALADRHSRTLAPLVAPRIGGRRANPVLLDRVTFPALQALSGDTGARQLFSEPDRFPVAWVDWEDPDLLLDVDTPEDYQRLLRRNHEL